MGLTNRLRAAQAKRGELPHGLHVGLSHTGLAREDERRAFLHGTGAAGSAGGARDCGRTPDKDITSEAIVRAGFAVDDASGARATGLGVRTVRRSRSICAEVLAQEQESALRDILGKASPFLVVKRSLDETPFYMRSESGTVMPYKLLNQRCFLRWSATQATRTVMPAVEMSDTRATTLLKAFQRVSPALDIEALRAAAARVPLPVFLLLSDAASSNKAMFRRRLYIGGNAAIPMPSTASR